MPEQIAHLEDLIAALEAQLALGREQHAALQAELAKSQARVRELERRLGRDSGHSRQPPSSAGLRKPPRPPRSPRRRSGRPVGGQPGPAGAPRRAVATPHQVVCPYPAQCAHCRVPRPGPSAAPPYPARQVFDLPAPPPLEVTAHRAYAVTCAGCPRTTRAAGPGGVTAPVPYGRRLAALVLYLHQVQLLPLARLTPLRQEVCGTALSVGTVVTLHRRAAETWQACGADLARRVRQEPTVKHLDETGLRAEGRLHWLHGVSTARWTHFRVDRRGAVGTARNGWLVHDRGAPYFRLTGAPHARCNAHHLRELQAVVDHDGEAWAGRLQRLLRRALRATELAQGPVRVRLVARIQRRYDQIGAAALAGHEAQPPLPRPGRGRPRRRPAHNLARALQSYQAETLRFLTDPAVPFTNNRAEQDLRMMKTRQKISGGFRTLRGAADFALLRSVETTARKLDWNRYELWLRTPAELAAALDQARQADLQRAPT